MGGLREQRLVAYNGPITWSILDGQIQTQPQEVVTTHTREILVYTLARTRAKAKTRQIMKYSLHRTYPFYKLSQAEHECLNQ